MNSCAVEINGEDIYHGSRPVCVLLLRLLNRLRREDEATYRKVIQACREALRDEQWLGITDAEWN